jgi:signal transduction histidine kinase
MKKRLTLLYIAAFLLPLSALLLFGTRAVMGERYRYKENVYDSYGGKLSIIRRDIIRVLEQFESPLELLLPLAGGSSEELREGIRESFFVRQIFIIDSNGELLFPSRDNPGNLEEAFFDRTSMIWDGGIDFRILPEAHSAVSGWYPYYEGNGTSWIYWHLLEDGRVFGADLFREVLIAELFLSMADWARAAASSSSEYERIVLRDELGRTLFVSGGYEPPEEEAPFVTAPLPDPFGGWRLEAYGDRALFTLPGTGLPLVLFGLAAALALAAAGFLLWRETRRELAEAGKRVSFVNQVSHELKTPLTNIRMYAELLTLRLEDARKEHGFAEIILRESERLSRMISNVLTFSREHPAVRKAPVNPDQCIKRIAMNRQALWARSGMDVEFKGGADTLLHLDGDILEQISWNLLSNAGKYAASGGSIAISTSFDEEFFTARFRDRGPGIPPRKEKAVFKPFYRIEDSLTEGVSGSGLGLSISRELARAHGGDLQLEHPGVGSLFILTMAHKTESDKAGG